MTLNSSKSNSLKPKEEGKKTNNQKRYYHNKKKKPSEKIEKKEVENTSNETTSPPKIPKRNKPNNKKPIQAKTSVERAPLKKEKELIPTFNKKGKNSKPQKKKELIPPFERRRIELGLVCYSCHKKIQDPFSAIASPDDPKEVYHFDCAIDKIKKEQPLNEGESIIYIGAGSFAIARVKRTTKLKTDFEIIRKIEFEPKKEDYLHLPWRKELQQK